MSVMHISDLNQVPLRRFRNLFASLDVPDVNHLAGKYKGTFVGPAWVRWLVKPLLWITGLGGWWGKDVDASGKAINIVLRKGKFPTHFPMEFIREKSQIDGTLGMTLYYQKGNPFPWMFIVDEMRQLDEITLLGMSHLNIPGLRWFALPFVLQKQLS